uniref:C-C motif chemokine n=1 Tax=Electrophorus electricus TaxID=8005 RepID=A0AAY5ETH8_ELEEL
MRNLCALLFVLLLCSLQLVSSGEHTPDCCTSVSDVKIPLKKVVSYTHTDTNCATKAIIFKTVAGKQFCVNPDAVFFFTIQLLPQYSLSENKNLNLLSLKIHTSLDID